MPVPRPADPRFRRARVRPAAVSRRRPWRRRLAVAAGAVLLLAAAGLTIAGVPRAGDLFAVRHIEIAGTTWVARGEVLALLEELRGANLVTIDLEHGRQRLLGSPWVADAALRRTLPSTITVVIAERRPVALARMGADLHLIDRDATVLDRFGPRYAPLDLPIVDGLAAGSARGPVAVDPRRAALAALVLASLEPHADLAARVSQIDVSDPHDAVLLLRDDTARVRVGDTHVVDRLRTYLEIAAALRGEVGEIDYVDLRFGGRVYLKPQPPADPAGAAPDGGRG